MFAGRDRCLQRQVRRFAPVLPGAASALCQIAIEIALGPALQNIVTLQEQDAQSAINYLKQNNLGRATFLPVTSI